jgi:GTP-binding protein
MRLPVVAIVGAPNVGKSTLFNRMLGAHRAIVSDRPGVTRDRIAAVCDLFGRRILLVDTGGIVTAAVDDLARGVRAEALKAVEEADLLLLLIDARAGAAATEEDLARILRSSGKPTVTVANKIDAATLEPLALEAYRLGLGEVIAVSAEQGRGLDELVETIRRLLPETPEVPEPPGVPLAIVGRPNVGKSSLFNRLVRQDRALVDPTPGTTRDPIDATFTHRGTLYRVVDTAGIRRRARGADPVEWVSVLKARQAMERAEIAIALVDAVSGVEHQDRAILGLVNERRTPAIVALNKIDLVRREERDERLRRVRDEISSAAGTPILALSARTGEGVPRLLAAVTRLRNEIHRRFTTPELNRALEQTIREKQPPSDGGREVRLYYMTQLAGAPPRFLIFGNGRRVGETYRRYLESRLRRRLGLGSSPLVLGFRSRPRSR